MGYAASILLDSISPEGVRLTTFEITFPRIVLAEFNTHKVFSRNSASSRAIPVERMIQRVLDDPFVPEYWGKNQKGMQAEQELDKEAQEQAKVEWLQARDVAVAQVQKLLDLGVHKQLTNRLLEPWLWHTVIVTATEYANFFALRCHPNAQPEIRKIALMMKELYDTSKPQPLDYGEWHLPLMPDIDSMVDIDIEARKKISVGRCARVSYLTHRGVRDFSADIALCERLIADGHMSPLEHVARPVELPSDRGVSRIDAHGQVWCGNFRGWFMMRKEIPNEDNFGARTV